MPISSNNSRKNKSHRVPEVAEQEGTTSVGRGLRFTVDPQTLEIDPLDQFKVFFKRNLDKTQPPVPTDLLKNIHDRIDRIKAGEE